MQKNSITNKITPCCGLPFSVVYWWVSNLTLNSESDRQFILSKISQRGTISIDGWKVLVNSGTLEADASLTKSEFLAWFDCGRQPKCEQLKLIIEAFEIGNWTPETELPLNIGLIDGLFNGQNLNGNVYTKEQANQLLTEFVNNINIGGRNYYPDGDFSKGTNQFVGGNNVTVHGVINTDFDENPLPWYDSKVFNIFTDKAGDTYALLSSVAKADADDYILSFYYKAAGSINGNSSYLFINGVPFSLSFSVLNDKQWRKVELPINITSKSEVKFRMGFICYAHAWMNVTRIKLEKGNKATDWTPAPEDIQTALDGKLDKGTYNGTAQDLKDDIDTKQKKLSSFDESILIETDGNIEGNVSLFEEYFGQQECELNFIPIQIIGVYVNGIKLKPSLYVITLPKKITVVNFTPGDYIEIQYTKLKI